MRHSPFGPPPLRSVRLSSAGVALTCAVTLSLGAGAHADDGGHKHEVDQQIEVLKGQLDDTSSALSSAYLALHRTQALLPAAQGRLAAATSALARADAYDDQMTAALQVAEADEAKAADELEQTSARIVSTRQQVAGFAAQMYQDQGLGQLSVALQATTPDQFASRIAMVDTVLDVQKTTLGRLSASRADATAQEAHLSALRRDVAAAKVRAEQAVTAATTARSDAEGAKQKLDALQAQQHKQAVVLAAQAAAEKQSLTAMQAESERLQKVLAARAKAAKLAAARAAAARAARAAQAAQAARAAQAAQAEQAARAARTRVHARPAPVAPPAAPAPAPAPAPTPAPTPAPAPVRGGGFLSFPENAPTSSEFGLRFHPILHYYRMHDGLDFAGPCGTPIHAAASGTIVSAGWSGGYGNRVVIDHGIVAGHDLSTTYNHLERLAVTGGQVSRGQVIGYEGTTGLSTGCHLHFETREDGTPVNPRSYL